MTSLVVSFSNQIKLNISRSKQVKILSKKLYSDFNWSFVCNKKIVGENFVS